MTTNQERGKEESGVAFKIDSIRRHLISVGAHSDYIGYCNDIEQAALQGGADRLGESLRKAYEPDEYEDAFKHNPPSASDGRDAERHPHTMLQITRCIAPSDVWFWNIVMPDGHVFNLKSGFDSSASAIMDALENAPDQIFTAEANISAAKGEG